MLDSHNKSVASIAARVRHFYQRKVAFRIDHGSTNSTRPRAFPRDCTIDTSSLSHILNIDIERMTVLVEPNVPMDRLVEATLDCGLVAPVVMEYPGITVGGGFAGTSGESGSFKHGYFDHTVNWVEMVLANGDVVTASDTERQDLFHGAAGAIGTLAITTLLELRLVKAKAYVELTYHPIAGVSDALRKVGEEAENPSIDYLDGILFALDRGVIMAGRLTDAPSVGVQIQRFSRARDPWFYIHAQDIYDKSPKDPTTEAVPIVDYLFRYDRGAFWTGKYAFEYFMTPFNWITRWALDHLMHTRVMYRALHESGHAHRYIIQDLTFPRSSAKQFIEYVDETLGAYPLWLCPLHPNHRVSMHPHTRPGSMKEEPLLNVGVWCPGPISHDKLVEVNRKIEQEVHKLSGMKWLYAHTYYSEEEFWSVYDRKWYDALRDKYDATSLPNVYDKVKVDVNAQKNAMNGVWAIWPISGVYGVLRASADRDRPTQIALGLSISVGLYFAIRFETPSLYILTGLVFLTRSRKVGLLTVLFSSIYGFFRRAG